MQTVERTMTGKLWEKAISDNAAATDEYTMRLIAVISREITAVTEFHLSKDHRYGRIETNEYMIEAARHKMLNQNITIALPVA